MAAYKFSLLIGTILALTPLGLLLFEELVWWINPVKTFTTKNGETIEIDFRKKYDRKTLEEFRDILEGRK